MPTTVYTTRRQDRATAWFLDRCYRLPDILVSWDDLQRARHLDLPAMPDAALARERYQVHHRLMYERPDGGAAGWLRERLRAVDAELARRRAGSRPPPTVAPAPARPAGAPRPFDLRRKGGA